MSLRSFIITVRLFQALIVPRWIKLEQLDGEKSKTDFKEIILRPVEEMILGSRSSNRMMIHKMTGMITMISVNLMTEKSKSLTAN